MHAAFLAGTSRMRWRRFLPADAAGGVVWAAVYTTAGYLAASVMRQVSGTITLIPGGLAIVAIVVVLVQVRRRTRRLAVRAEAAYPGPLS